MLLNKSSYHVARVRDASKVQVPKLLNERFSRELTAEERTALTNGLMKTDAGALRHVMSSVNIRRMYQDPAALDREIARIEAQVASRTGGKPPAVWLDRAKALTSSSGTMARVCA